MFRFLRRRQPPQPQDSPDYDGEGIWFACPDCGALHPTGDDTEFRDLIEQLCCEIGASSRALYDEFGVTDPDGSWNAHPEEKLFRFTNSDGRIALAEYGVVGSWNPDSHSWLWAWGFPEDWFPEPALEVANRLYDAGLDNGWQATTERTLAVNEHEAWHLTNLAAHVSEFPMTYRAKVNDKNWHYFALSRPRWAH